MITPIHQIITLFLLSGAAIATEAEQLPNVAAMPVERRDLPSWVTVGPALPQNTASRLNFCFGDEDPYDCLKSSPEFMLCEERYPSDSLGRLQKLYCWCTGGYNEYKHRCNYCMARDGVERSLSRDELDCEGYRATMISSGLLGPGASETTSSTRTTPTETTATTTRDDDETTTKATTTPRRPTDSFTEISRTFDSGNWFEDTETATPEPTATGSQATVTVTAPPGGSDSTTVRPLLLAVFLSAAFSVVFS